jgi:hypothetical protein
MFSSMLSLLGSLRRGNFVQRSLRFRSSASAYLNRTPSVAGNRRVWTWSGWVKRGSLSSFQQLFSYFGGTTYDQFRFDSDDTLQLTLNNGNSANTKTSAVFRDPSAWYHIVALCDTTNATANDRLQLWVNGVRQSLGTNTQPTQNYDTYVNTTNAFNIGRLGSGGSHFDGYLTEVNFIDGQALTPSSFGQIESTTGVWSPKQYAGSYGTNGFYLKFNNTSSVAALGTDSSGNGNTWTVNNVSLTAGATYDSMVDVPVNYSDSGNGRGNYAVLNPLSVQGVNTGISNGNLSVSLGTASNRGASGAMFVQSGKWYFEMIAIGSSGGDQIGVISETGTFSAGQVSQGALYWSNGNKTVDGASSAYGASYTTNDVIGVALDNDLGSVTFYKNNVSQGAISIAVRSYSAAICTASSVASGPFNINFGQRPFAYTPPAGFRALNTNNLPTPTIVNGANFMAATTYTGNAAARSLSNAVNNVSFQPDLVWIKSRTPGATNHALFDSSRGVTKYLSSNTTTAETTLAQSLTALNADGFSLGTDTTLVNASANSYVAWQWKAGGAAVSNTQGTITSQVSANTTAGLSIATYTGTGVNATVGHGLGVAPKMVIVKRRAGAVSSWGTWHTSLSGNEYVLLDSVIAKTVLTTLWNSTVPNSNVISVGTDATVNALASTYVAYCFAEIAGFSKIGSYTGNGSADGPFVFCGFRPRFVMIKRTDSTGNWILLDTARSTFNAVDINLFADLSNAEANPAGAPIDTLSNGFKMRTSGLGYNASGGTFIFAAFAEVPSKYALAR